MENAVNQIDEALKSLYNLEHSLRASDFLIKTPTKAEVKIANAAFKGALLLRANDTENTDLSIAIYLNKQVHACLSDIEKWRSGDWSLAQLGAFLVAAEEISHFNYFVYHSKSGRGVSEFELELQGEIDKFLLTYLANLHKNNHNIEVFEALFERLFEQFTLPDSLSDVQRERYLEANHFASRFIHHCAPQLRQKHWELALPKIRYFYRLAGPKMVQFIYSL